MSADGTLPKKTALQTQMIHGGMLRTGFGETSEAIFPNSGFIYETAETAEARFKGDDPGFIYSRFSNPTVEMFETRMALLEGAEAARATASGMAAIHAAIVSQVEAGDHVIAARALFGSCRWIVEKLLPSYGVAVTLVDGSEVRQWQDAVRPNTKLFFFETPSNPALGIVDIREVAAIAREAGARVIVDNVFATPIGQKPLQLGADIVVYSATKHIDGQGRCLGGVILSSQDIIDETLHDYLRHTGPALSPFNAWTLLKGLETLPIRVAHHFSNAERIAQHFEHHPALAGVLFPGLSGHPGHAIAREQMNGFGSLVGLDLKGGKEAAFRFMNALDIIQISNNLGDAKSLVTHPATTTHHKLDPEEKARVGITPGFVRLSVGLEAADDLIGDIEQALAAV
ncbi:MAG: O-succinylhomoserine sulfhydrylase [Pseudomonadota bacterium]